MQSGTSLVTLTPILVVLWSKFKLGDCLIYFSLLVVGTAFVTGLGSHESWSIVPISADQERD